MISSSLRSEIERLLRKSAPRYGMLPRKGTLLRRRSSEVLIKPPMITD